MLRYLGDKDHQLSKRGGSRGQKKASLRDLSRKLPSSEEFRSIIEEIDKSDPRAAALVMAALLDNYLEKAIVISLDGINSSRYAALFSNPNAPISSFSSKILLASSIGIIKDLEEKYLNTIRAIRNHFAHTIVAADFEDSMVRSECMKLDPQALTDMQYQPDDDTPRERFCMSALIIQNNLIKYITTLHKIRTGQPLSWQDLHGQPHHEAPQNEDKKP